MKTLLLLAALSTASFPACAQDNYGWLEGFTVQLDGKIYCEAPWIEPETKTIDCGAVGDDSVTSIPPNFDLRGYEVGYSHTEETYAQRYDWRIVCTDPVLNGKTILCPEPATM